MELTQQDIQQEQPQQEPRQNHVRFLYLRDPKDSRRVITIARKVDLANKKITFAFAVNRPTQRDEYGFIISKGDVFRKKAGRLAALGRLEAGRGLEIEFGHMRPIETIIKFLALEAPIKRSRDDDGIPDSVKRIAKHIWDMQQQTKDPVCMPDTTAENARFVDPFEPTKNC